LNSGARVNVRLFWASAEQCHSRFMWCWWWWC